MDRPKPPVVDPGAYTQPTPPPADAIVLFNGHDVSNWERADSAGKPARWKVQNGYIEVAPGTGDISTKEAFGDCQLHIEWATPTPPTGEGQERGNSGVYMAKTYEVQVLDSYNNPTYADGQAASIYGQYPPLVNASRPAGQWQTYDIIWHGPRFNENGTLLRPARITVFHNGVLVQDNVTLSGPTANKRRPPYAPQPAKMPLELQDHSYPVRFRDIWVRAIPD
ncbi:MAG TPA: DUF1080 domain-containing protein [Gemmatimonadaceae bacterium]|nr:DUF1080 domain-containing protein [Gemmatimonadaceae bacterium]